MRTCDNGPAMGAAPHGHRAASRPKALLAAEAEPLEEPEGSLLREEEHSRTSMGVTAKAASPEMLWTGRI